ncbi:glycosyltransferase family 4 protein [Flavobacterium sp.]|uniref:glycosyltransferase family 4 protein n=1 Tax=Flavobacterium sp. TaxID=239 RepID=UPI0035290CF0
MAIESKRILLVTSEFPPLPGGIGNHAFLLAKYLQKSNYEVSVLADYRSIKEDDGFDEAQFFKIIRVKRNFLTYINRFKKAFSLIKRNDVVISSGKFSLWLGAFLKLFFKNKKYIAVLHGSELKAGNHIVQKLTKWSLSKYDNLIAVSNFTKEYALQVNPNLKIDVINNGIEINTIAEKRTISNEINLVTVGNVTYRKGQQNVIKALPLLKEYFPSIHYHCIGIPTEKSDFLELAKELNVEHNVTFHGKLEDDDKMQLLREGTIFIMLSDIVKNDFEGFGIAILEANSVGLPAIGSNNSGIVDAINNHFSGFLVNPHNKEEILKAVHSILNDYANFSENAISWAYQFDWKKVIEKYVKIIEQ